MRERKQIAIRWTGLATADVELAKLHEYVRAFMEWTPYPEGPGSGIPYTPPVAVCAWLEALAALLSLFLNEKSLLPREQLPEYAPILDAFAPHAFSPVASSLAWISLRSRTASLRARPRHVGCAAQPAPRRWPAPRKLLGG